MSIPELDRDTFSLPADMESVVYGETMEVVAEGPSKSTCNLEALSGSIQELLAMEVEAQNIYLNFKSFFKRK